MTAVEQSLNLWIPQVTGRYLNEDWNPENLGFGAQCWDAAANWSKYLGLPVISTGGKGRWPGWAGNMVDAFPQSPEIAAAYELHGPDDPGLPGDIVVFGDGYYFYPKTHVAVLVKDLSAQLLCISQNSSASLAGNPYPQWTTGPTILQHLPRRGLIGLIRPRTGGLAAQGTTTPQEEGFLMALSDPDQRDMQAAVGRIDDILQHPEKFLLSLQDQRDMQAAVGRIDDWSQHPERLVGIITESVVKAAPGVAVDVIRQAVADGLSAGIKIDATVKVGDK